MTVPKPSVMKEEEKLTGKLSLEKDLPKAAPVKKPVVSAHEKV